MSELFSAIQKQIFPVTLFSATLLGASLAYLFSVIMQYSFKPELKFVSIKRPQFSRKNIQTRSFQDFEALITGRFIRDSGEMISSGTEDIPSSSASIILKGLLAGSPRFASAAIQISGEKEANQYYTGDVVAGHKIIRITSNSVIVEKGGSRFPIKIGGDGIKGQSLQKMGSKTGGAVRKTSISRTRLNALLKDQKALAKAKFVPFNYKGKMMGIKLLIVPTNHVFYKLGARSGDIIRRFNGEKLNSTERLIQLYQSLRTINRATIDLERSGKIMTFDFVVTD